LRNRPTANRIRHGHGVNFSPFQLGKKLFQVHSSISQLKPRISSMIGNQLEFGGFTLSDFKSTTIGDNIFVTFTMTVAETIDGKRLPAKPAYRLSVWKKGANGWQWISHANLAPIR